MKSYKYVFCIFILFLTIYSLNAQSASYAQRFNNGTALYNSERYYEAAIEFRRAQEISANQNDWSRAIYWVILSQLAYTDYGSAILDMDELEKRAPNSIYNRDMAYHRARIYYNQGYFEDAMLLFRQYINSVHETDREAEDRKAAAYYWMGESLFAMGQFDEAERFFRWVLDYYPESPKREISLYRIDLIKQKKIEAELLALLQWSHEESLRTSEDYQRRLRTYEYTLNVYQRRIAELSQGASYEAYNTDDYLIQPPVEYLESYDNPLSESYSEYYQRLLDKARQLGIELEQLIFDYEHGGGL